MIMIILVFNYIFFMIYDKWYIMINEFFIRGSTFYYSELWKNDEIGKIIEISIILSNFMIDNH